MRSRDHQSTTLLPSVCLSVGRRRAPKREGAEKVDPGRGKQNTVPLARSLALSLSLCWQRCVSIAQERRCTHRQQMGGQARGRGGDAEIPSEYREPTWNVPLVLHSEGMLIYFPCSFVIWFCLVQVHPKMIMGKVTHIVYCTQIEHHHRHASSARAILFRSFLLSFLRSLVRRVAPSSTPDKRARKRASERARP